MRKNLSTIYSSPEESSMNSRPGSRPKSKIKSDQGQQPRFAINELQLNLENLTSKDQDRSYDPYDDHILEDEELRSERAEVQMEELP